MMSKRKKLTQEELIELKRIVKERAPSSNMMVAQILNVIGVVCLILRVFFEFTSLNTDSTALNIACIYLPIMLISFSCFCVYKRGKASWMQYVLLIMLSILILAINIMSGYKSNLILCLPMIFSIRYYDRRFSVFIYCLCIFLLFVSTICNVYLVDKISLVDLNTVSFNNSTPITINGFMADEVIGASIDKLTLLKNSFVLMFFPNFIFLSLIHLTIFNIMINNQSVIKDLNDALLNEKAREAELVDVKTKAILSQVKPHFIYNTLTSIAYLCGKEPSKAKELTLEFSDYLRTNLDSITNDGLSMISFSEELKHIKNYLKIEMTRFQDTLNVEYDIEYDDFEIAALSVQPIVENAVKHGICKKEGGGTIKIATTKDNDGYKIIVDDDGVGFDLHESLNDGRIHVGMVNTKKRIELSGNKVELLSKKGEGTHVVITVPFKKEK